jgi:hypothetical protein
VIPNPPEIWPETVRAAVPVEPPLLAVQVWLAPRVIFEEIVWVVAAVFAILVTVMKGVVPPKVMLPPESVVLLPEPELTKVREFASTEPETVIVPVPSWFVLEPKFKALVVLVVVVPESAEEPVEEEDHPCVALFVVGAAQIPPAAPKPVVALFVSQ